jgi:hypothetical protein
VFGSSDCQSPQWVPGIALPSGRVSVKTPMFFVWLFSSTLSGLRICPAISASQFSANTSPFIST